MKQPAKQNTYSQILDIRFNPVHDRDSVSFYSPRLALATLPTKDPKLPPGMNLWAKDCGRAHIELVADWERDAKRELKLDKKTNLPVAAFPYGSFPRLTLVWLISEVTKTKRKEVILGSSILNFLKEVGYTKNHVNYRRLEKQLTRLFNCQLTINMNISKTHQGKELNGHYWKCNRIANETSLWWSTNDGQDGLFDSKVNLTQEFYDGILAHGFPIDFDIVRLFHAQPFVLDIYLWLAYRIYDINNKDALVPIPWDALQWQFGNYTSNAEFRREFKKAIKAIQRPWQGLNIYFNRQGIQLSPSSLSVPTKPPLLKLDK